MDKLEFGKGMDLLAELFDKSLSEPLAKIYFEALQSLTDEQWRGAVESAVNGCTFFPKPAELLEFAHGSSEDKALLAWDFALKTLQRKGRYESVEFDDPAINAAIRTIGGWQRFGEITNEEFPFRQRDFFAAYRLWVGRNPGKQGEYLAGITEQTNIGKWGAAHTDVVKVSAGDKPTLALPSGESGGRGLRGPRKALESPNSDL